MVMRRWCKCCWNVVPMSMHCMRHRKKGHAKWKQELFDYGVLVNALQAASLNGHEKVAQMRLDKGADVNAQGGYYATALQVALSKA